MRVEGPEGGGGGESGLTRRPRVWAAVSSRMLRRHNSSQAPPASLSPPPRHLLRSDHRNAGQKTLFLVLCDRSTEPRGVRGRDALEGEGPQKQPQKRSDRRLEEVANAVGGGYCRLQMSLKPALAVKETVAGHRLGALEGGTPAPFQCIPGRGEV